MEIDKYELLRTLASEIGPEERQEAIRQVRAAGHLAVPVVIDIVGRRNDIIRVMRVEEDKPSGTWQTICTLFYDQWIDGEQVPSSIKEALENDDGNAG
jgi:hypothetical protein